MRLFFKHFFRSILRRPLQPFILIFTLMLSVAVSVMALTIDDAFADETKAKQAAQYGTADITVTLNGTSSSRFMFAQDAQKLLGDRAKVAGCYKLPLFFGEKNETVFAVAVDFADVGNIFSFRFTEYGTVFESDLPDTAFISKAFAKREGLSVGDDFKIRAFGEERNYKVGGVCSDFFLSSYDIMVDITGIMRLVSADSLLISALGDTFKPSSTVYISVNDGFTADECIELLQTSSDFSDKSFTNVAGKIDSQKMQDITSTVVRMLIMLCCALAAAVTFCCFYLLEMERIAENAIFIAAGAIPLRLYLVQYAEIFLYWAIGSAFSVPLSILFLKITDFIAGFHYASITLRAENVIESASLVLVFAMLTGFLFILSQRRKGIRRHEKTKRMLLLALLFISVALFLVSFGVKTTSRFTCAVIAFLFFMLLVFCVTPGFLRALTKWADAKLDKRAETAFKYKAPALRCALKNIFSVRVLHNFSRLTSILVATVLCSFYVMAGVNGYVGVTKNLFDCDYTIINATESCYQKVLECESLARVEKVFFGSATIPSGVRIEMISASDVQALSGKLNLHALPEKDEAVISSGYAKHLSLREGDTLAVQINGRAIALRITEIVDSGVNVAYFDCEHFGISYNMLLAKGNGTASSSEILEEIVDKTALEFAAVMSVQELMVNRNRAIDIYLNSGHVLLVSVICFAVIGMVDNLLHSYRARREELALYRLCGMSRRSIRNMIFFEVTISLVYAFLLGAISFVVGAIIINQAIGAFGFELLYNAATLF